MTAKRQDRQYKAAFFDIDGTTALTDERNFAAILAAARQHGGDFSKQEWDSMTGTSDLAVWELVKGKHAAFRVQPETFLKSCVDHCLTSAFRLNAVPGAVSALHLLKRENFLLAAVTNARRAVGEDTLRRVRLRDKFSFVVAADDVLAAGRNIKPNPDPYLMAAEKFGVKPEECLVYEDSGGGVRSGKAAGMTVVQVCIQPPAVPSPNADYIAHNGAQLRAITRFLANQPKL